MIDWDALPKPWTKEQCCRRYVEGGDDIGIRGLVEISGVSKGNLCNWSIEGRDTECGGWVEQRLKFESDIREATRQKTIAKTSDTNSADIGKIRADCYNPHKQLVRYVSWIIQQKIKKLKSLEGASDAVIDQEMKKNHNGYEINYWSLILTRSTDSLYKLTGMEYDTNINAAAAKLESEGFIISDPSDAGNDGTTNN